MGRKDSITKKYMSDPNRFADFFNTIVYNGKSIIKAENLVEKDTIGIALPFVSDKKSHSIQKYRDIFKSCIWMASEEANYLLLGIENQSSVHYAMPVRVMLYNAITYTEQVDKMIKEHRLQNDIEIGSEYLSGYKKEDRLVPIITITLYWGEETWDGPVSLKEMYAEYDSCLEHFIDDCNINLFSIVDEKSFDGFTTTLGKIFEALHYRNNYGSLKKVIENDKVFLHLDKESAEILNEFANIKMPRKNKEGEYDMCTAIKQMEKIYTDKGLDKGLKALVETLKPILNDFQLVCDAVRSNEDYKSYTDEQIRKYW